LKKSYLFLILCIIGYFLLLWIIEKDVKLAFHITLFVVGMSDFNFAICYQYRELKRSKFNFKEAATSGKWIKFGIFTGLPLILFLLFLPKFLLLLAGLMTGLLLTFFFFYDLVKNGLR
jgi:cobalamin synthase